VAVAITASVAACGSSAGTSSSAAAGASSTTPSSATASSSSAATQPAQAPTALTGPCAPVAEAATPAATGPPGPSLASLIKSHGPAFTSVSFVQRNCSVAKGAAVINNQVATVQLKPKLLMNETSDVAGKTLQVRFIGDTGYVYLAQLAAEDNGRPWMSMTLSQAGAAIGVNLQQLFSQVEDLNPSRNLKVLAAANDFKQLGRTTIDGQQAYGYQGSFSAAHLPSTFSKSLTQQLLGVLARVGATREISTSYVTPAGRAVRTVTVLVTKSHGDIVNVQDLRGVNVPVSVTPPPASKTISYDKLKALGG
jgi:hypothetical protein